MAARMRLLAAVTFVGALAACSAKNNPSDKGALGDGAASGSDSLGDFATIVAQYKSWQPQSAAPENISAYIFGLCRAPTLHETDFSTSEHGKERYLLDWANTSAVEGLKQSGVPAFAVGSAIVKEKLVPGADGGFGVVALGIMSKREPRFDPGNGDWDYGYWEESPGLLHSAAQTAHCGGCHAGAKDSDFVFVDKTWLGK